MTDLERIELYCKNVATVELFKSYIGERDSSVNKEALCYGILIPESAPKDVVQDAIQTFGIEKHINNTFHKSFNTVATASIEQLVMQQIVHYITTYGFESLGCYDSASVYLPAEAVEIPEIDITKLKLTAIMPITEEELKVKLLTLLTSGIALSESSISNISHLLYSVDISEIESVKNREIRTKLYDKYNIVPADPEEFLRYLIYKLGCGTLKIQSRQLISKLKESNINEAIKLLELYSDYNRLSSIFLRNKKLFLALKRNAEDINNAKSILRFTIIDSRKEAAEAAIQNASKINSIINKLRKLANKNHVPVKAQLLDTLTSAQSLDKEKLTTALNKVNSFRALRLMNTLSYRLSDSTDMVYHIRNGKSFATNISNNLNKEVAQIAYNAAKDRVVTSLKKSVQGKLIYMSSNIIYKAPTSEKMFEGNIPSGSYIELGNAEDIVVAVHWTNLESINERVDLDLHLTGKNSCYGWNTSYVNGRDVIYSGDITDAPASKGGATEAYYISQEAKDEFILKVNSYTCNKISVPFEFVICSSSKDEIEENYVIDPNKIIAKFNYSVQPGKYEMSLGSVSIVDGKLRYYLASTSTGSRAVSRMDNLSEIMINYSNKFAACQPNLRDLLEEAGAVIINEPELIVDKWTGKTIKPDIDLSLENIDKTTLIKLFNV